MYVNCSACGKDVKVSGEPRGGVLCRTCSPSRSYVFNTADSRGVTPRPAVHGTDEERRQFVENSR